MATTIRTYRHSPTKGADPTGTLVDTETDPDDGNFSVSVDTAGWTPGSYELSVTAQKSGETESAKSNAFAITVNSGAPVAVDGSYLSPYQNHVLTGINLPANSWVLIFEGNMSPGAVTGATVNGASASWQTGVTSAANPSADINAKWGTGFFAYWNTSAQTGITITTTGSTNHDGRMSAIVLTGSGSSRLGTPARAAVTTAAQVKVALTSVQASSLLVWALTMYPGPVVNPATTNTILQSGDNGGDTVALGRYNGTPAAGTYDLGLADTYTSGIGAYLIAVEVKPA